MNHAVLALNLLAFVSGAGALAFVLAVSRGKSGPAAKAVARAILCLTFIAACNCVDFYLKAFAGVDDWRFTFMTMNLLTLASLLSIGILFRFVGMVVRLAYSDAARASFGVFSFAVYVACLSLALFVPDRPTGISLGFLVSALFCALCILIAAILVLARRSAIDRRDRRFAVRVAAFFVAWVVFDACCETGLWLSLFGLPQVAMSPFFLIFLSVLTVVRAARPDSMAASRESAEPVAAGSSAPPAPPARWGLSEREAEVFSLLVTGLENAEISDRLCISPHTVKNHITNVYRKAGARNRLELVGILRSLE